MKSSPQPIRARVEQPVELRRLAHEGAEVAPLGIVAAGAGPGEVARVGRSTVFAADDVVHMTAPERVILVDEAVLTNVVGAFGDLSAQPFAHVTGHERGVAGRGLWPAA